MSRRSLALAVLAAMILLSSGIARAQSEGPWCATVFNGEGSVREICHFKTIEACIAEVVAGNRGQCGQNPRYVAARRAQWSPAGKTKRKHHSY
jgi:hypothetical protein